MTIGGFLAREERSREFIGDVILPIASGSLVAPACRLPGSRPGSIRGVVRRRRFLSIGNRKRWRTVVGGSHEGVRRLVKPFEDRVRLRTAVRSVTRSADGVRVLDAAGARGSIRSGRVRVARRSDTGAVDRRIRGRAPRAGRLHIASRTRCISTTIAARDAGEPRRTGPPGIYFSSMLRTIRTVQSPTRARMNRLQGSIDDSLPTFVSLNPMHEPAPALTAAAVFLRASHAGRRHGRGPARRAAIQVCESHVVLAAPASERGGRTRTPCGRGFRVARRLGVDLPWT